MCLRTSLPKTVFFEVTTTNIDSFQNVGRTQNPEKIAIDTFYVPQVTTIVKADCRRSTSCPETPPTQGEFWEMSSGR